MACYHPIKGYRSKIVGKSGKRAIVFKPKDGYTDLEVTVPCGQCIGCRLERSRQWAIRCVHESMLHDNNCFITLTYSDQNLPKNGSLEPKDFQLFMKRMRRKFGKMRFFHCGEYGGQHGRPHHHACIFGFDPPDKKLWRKENGNNLYTSEMVSERWENKGYVIIGNVTFESAAYVARYITKKINGPRAASHYEGRKPEYITMSRRPGIAKEFYDQYKKSIYDNDEVIINQKRMKPPKYYDMNFEIDNPEKFRYVKYERENQMMKSKDYGNSKRLQTKEKIQLLKAGKLKRGYENENSDVCDLRYKGRSIP